MRSSMLASGAAAASGRPGPHTLLPGTSSSIARGGEGPGQKAARSGLGTQPARSPPARRLPELLRPQPPGPPPVRGSQCWQREAVGFGALGSRWCAVQRAQGPRFPRAAPRRAWVRRGPGGEAGVGGRHGRRAGGRDPGAATGWGGLAEPHPLCWPVLGSQSLQPSETALGSPRGAGEGARIRHQFFQTFSRKERKQL